MADNLLDKASILLTPTAYDNGSMLSVKPEVAFGEELSTNGDFSNGTTGWSNGSSTLSVVDGKLKILATGSFSYARQNIAVVSGKKYKISVNFFYNSLVGNIEVFDGTTNTISEQLSKDGVITLYVTPNSTNLRLTLLNRFGVSGDFNYWDNVSVKEDLSGDFQFQRNSAATRVNAQGLVENVQIISPELVSNGNFSQIGTEEVLNGNFSQESSELVTNGSFDTDSDWSLQSGVSISQNKLIVSNVSQNTTIATQSSVAPTQKPCKLQFDIVVNTGSFRILLGSSGTSTTVTESGTYTLYETSGNFGTLTLQARDGGFDGSIDNVSVKEVGQNWVLGTGWSIGEDKAISDGTINQSLLQPNLFTIGKSYKINFTISDVVGSLNARIWMATGGAKIEVNANGNYTTYWQADGINLYTTTLSTNTATYSITNISVKEVGQDWSVIDSDADNYVEFNQSQGTARLKFLNTSPLTKLQSTAQYVSGKKYKLIVDVAEVVSGGIKIDAGGVQQTYNTVGIQESIIEPTGNQFIAFYRATADVDITLNSVSVKEITDDTNIPRINYEGFSYQDALGNEEVVNGDFSNGSANWIFNNSGGTFGWRIENDRAICDSNASTPNRNLNSTFSLVNGKTYKLTLDILQSEDNMQIVIGSTALSQTLPTGTNLNYEYIITPSMHSGGVFGLYGGSSDLQEIDNISVKEYLGQEIVPGSGCGSWLLEPQSTNLIPYSSDFSNVGWIKSGSSVESGYLSPSGETNASKFTAINTDPYLLDAISGVTNLTYSASLYIKGTTSTIGKTARLWIIRDNVVFHNEDFTITDIWQRISTTKTFTSTPTSFVSLRVDLPNTNVSIGDETYIWGAQLEAQSYATSYIPTNGAANTRLQDIADNSGNSSLIDSTEGVLYAEIAALANDLTFRGLSISDGTTSNACRIYYRNSSNRMQFLFTVGGASQVSSTFDLADIKDYNKIAFSYKQNDFKIYINGVKVITDTNGIVPSENTFNKLSFNRGDNGEVFYGKAKAVAVYKEALTDAELQSLTTI